ncbi:MAG: hypothetical protein OK456_09205 [Thaumarchaeota archaeon]|nr:hypothetical protein [Nitrososphaerota archaeon]
MAKREQGTYMVRLRDASINIDDLKVGISEITGVLEVQANYLTRKLMISYDGAEETLERIKSRLAGIDRPAGC